MLSCGGLEAIVSCMHRAVNRLHESSKYIELAVCLTNTLDAVIADNGRNFVLIHNAILK